jgi:hypothetical protein
MWYGFASGSFVGVYWSDTIRHALEVLAEQFPGHIIIEVIRAQT